MGFLRKSTLAAAMIAAGFSTAASADYQYGFGNVSINYLDWSSGTESRAKKKDFMFLELEGGAGFDWGHYCPVKHIQVPDPPDSGASRPRFSPVDH